MIGIPLGLLYCNAGEWWIHKHLLHDAGKKKDSFWHFHWVHHRIARKNGMYDAGYERLNLFRWNHQTKEIATLAAAAAAHVPLAPVAPFFVGTVLYGAVNYYRKHRRSHLDVEWGRTHLPWHWDHHMGKDQDTNWCVTHPFFDLVMGTRDDARERRERAKTSGPQPATPDTVTAQARSAA